MFRLPTISSLLALSLLCLAATGAFVEGADEQPGDGNSVARKISVDGLTQFGEPTFPKTPIVLKNSEELAKLITDKKVLDEIVERVDFDKEWLAFFRWNGSGQDRVTVQVTRDEQGVERVTFPYQPGRTKDLREHAALFAVPHDVKFGGDKPGQSPRESATNPQTTPPGTSDAAVSKEVQQVREALATWKTLKEKHSGNYSYKVRFASAFGFGSVTTIVVRDNQVTERRFVEFSANPRPLPPGEAPADNGWIELGKEIGTHKQGAPGVTLDDLYADAEKIASADLPEHERRYIRTDKQGLLTTCLTVDTRIADDAPTKGISIQEIVLVQP
ncbi:MAG: hypothetical protein R3C01_03450 [Planctomycetaceae bacterium]